MTDSNRLSLPYLAAAQAQKHVTHNEALTRLDALVQIAVLETRRNAPPASPGEGDCYLVGPSPTGVFAGKTGVLAAFDDGAWRFLTPRAGWLAWSVAERIPLLYDGTTWRELGSVLGPVGSVSALGIGTTADAGNPLSARLNDALLTARPPAEGGSGDLRLKLNKDTAGATASHLFQRGYAGRAETGLIGDDRYRIKVSADGTVWRDLLIADPSSGAPAFPNGIADIGGGPVAGLRNLVVNGEFAVAQRGVGPFRLSAAGNLYGLDGWLLRAEGVATLSLSRAALPFAVAGQGPQGGFCASLAVTATISGANAGIETRLEDPSRLAGRGVTLSFWYRQPLAGFELSLFQDLAAGAGRELVAGSVLSLPVSAGWRRVSLPISLPALAARPVGAGAHTGIRFILKGANPASLDLADIQLEQGAIATPFERRPIALDLLLARRLFRRQTVARDPADLAPAMRATPVQTGTGPFDYSAEL